MSGLDIANKVKLGLSKATKATGTGELVYLVVKTSTGGDSPLNPPVITTDETLLVDAIFKGINKSLINGDSIRSGDRLLIANGDVVINQNDIIKQGDSEFIVVAVERKEPSGVLLSQVVQLRSL